MKELMEKYAKIEIEKLETQKALENEKLQR
jgi:hypothetical protein